MAAGRVLDTVEECTCFVSQNSPFQLGYIRIDLDKGAAAVFTATGSLLHELTADDIECVVDAPTLPSGVQVRLRSAEPLTLSHILRKAHLTEVFKAIGKWSGEERAPLKVPQAQPAVATKQASEVQAQPSARQEAARSRHTSDSPGGDTVSPTALGSEAHPITQHTVTGDTVSPTTLGSEAHTNTQHTVTGATSKGCGRQSVLARTVHSVGHRECAMLFRRCVSRNAAGKGRAVLEGVGLSSKAIEMCYANSPRNEEEAVQSGLNRWRDGEGASPTWAVLFEAMDYAEIGVQYITALEEGVLKAGVPLEGEPSPPQEGPSPPIVKEDHITFDKLRSYYTSKPVVQNSFLVGPAMDYVKMNLIQPRQHIPRAGQDGAFASVNLCEGGVDEVPNQRVPSEYEDIFNFQPHGGGSRRRVLIEGVPGSGKTTLVKRMCRDWSNGSFAQDSKAVIQVVLRSLPKRDKLAIEDMVLTSVADEKVAADIAQYVRNYQGEGVLFILDGFDEISKEMRQSSIVCDILEGRLAPKASFLITSRPISAQSLYHLVDRRIEVTGFGEREVKKYVRDYFAASDVAVGEKLISTLRSRPTIRSLCYVPLLLLMVCFVASFGKALPHTMNELFGSLVILIVNRNLEKSNRNERAKSLEDVKRICPSFMKLAHLALEGLKNDTLVFCDIPFEVDEALSGLVNCIEALNRFGGTTRTFHFLHLTLQEYFAAYALLGAPEAEVIGFWRERLLFKYTERRDIFAPLKYILSADRFHTMFLLYCGVTGLGSKTGVQAMLVEAADAMFQPTIEDGSALSALCQAVSESGNRELACRVMSTCGSNVQVRLDHNLPAGIPWCIEVYGQHTEELCLSIRGHIEHATPSDTAYFLSQMKDLVTLSGLELSLWMWSNEGNLPHWKTIAQFLTRQKTLKHLTLSFYLKGGRSFTEDEVSCFWSVLEHHSGSLESVGLEGCEVSQSCVITILSKLPNLTALNLDDIRLPDNERNDELVAGAISSAVYNHPSLKELTTGVWCPPSLVNGAVGGIVGKAGVKKLVVRDVFPDHLLPQAIHSLKNQSLDVLRLTLSLESISTVALFRALPQSRLKEFQFTLSDRPMDISTALCREMEKGISDCSTLTKLSVHSWNKLPPQYSSASMRAAMALQSSLTEVEWSYCSFDGTGPLLKDFAVHLKHSRLRKVTFDWCALTSVDVATLLAEGLSENRTLEQLQINDSSSSTQFVQEVVDAALLEKVETSIERNKSLQKLYMWTDHGDVVDAILKGARGNTSLKQLTIKAPYRGRAHDREPLKAAAAEFRQVRPQLEFHVY